MSPLQVACPGCGAPVTFRLGSSLVTVCEHCRSVIGRGDRNVEDLGKIAYLAETDSPLEIGMQGRYRGTAFEVLGVAQLGHEAGGSWYEWYLAFGDGRWGWLAEAQGRFYITFAIDAEKGTVPICAKHPAGRSGKWGLSPFPSIDLKGREKIPAYDALELGTKFRLSRGDPPMMVAEKGLGQPIAARGEIPYRLVPNETYQYADLSGPGGRFATLDYSDSPPSVYYGQEVSLDQLNLPLKTESYEREPRQVEAIHLDCPNCGGALTLQAPDQAQRVGCPSCGSLLDATEGKLRLLQAATGAPSKLPLPLGTVGRLHGVDYTVIGFLRRGVHLDVWYYWQEYLLYNQRIGFRWLVCSDRHWSFVEPLPPGSVELSGAYACYGGERFRWFQKGIAEVKTVLGEFYWKVAVGEQVAVMDYIRPPESLSREITQAGDGAGEINWSRGAYLPVEEVERAFGLKQPLPRPSTVGASEPFAYKWIYPYWAAFVAAVLLLGLMLFLISHRRAVIEQNYSLARPATADEAQVFFDGPFELRGHQNVELAASAAATNFWLWIDGDLVEESTGLVQGFSLPLQYYKGVESGEAWSEGGQTSCAYLSALPAGQYTVRLEVHGDPKNPPLQIHLRIRQDVPRPFYWLLAILGVSAIPAAIAGYHVSFESRRWSDSNVREE